MSDRKRFEDMTHAELVETKARIDARLGREKAALLEMRSRPARGLGYVDNGDFMSQTALVHRLGAASQKAQAALGRMNAAIKAVNKAVTEEENKTFERRFIDAARRLLPRADYDMLLREARG